MSGTSLNSSYKKIESSYKHTDNFMIQKRFYELNGIMKYHMAFHKFLRNEVKFK